MRRIVHILFDSTLKIKYLVRAGFLIGKFGSFGKLISVLIDKVLYLFFSMEVCSRFVDVQNLIVSHSVGVVLGGTGIKCTGTLRVASGVVFGVDMNDNTNLKRPAFNVDGDLTVGANAVIIGPTQFTGPVVVGALTFLKLSGAQKGTYVGNPARCLKNDIDVKKNPVAE